MDLEVGKIFDLYTRLSCVLTISGTIVSKESIFCEFGFKLERGLRYTTLDPSVIKFNIMCHTGVFASSFSQLERSCVSR